MAPKKKQTPKKEENGSKKQEKNAKSGKKEDKKKPSKPEADEESAEEEEKPAPKTNKKDNKAKQVQKEESDNEEMENDDEEKVCIVFQISLLNNLTIISSIRLFILYLMNFRRIPNASVTVMKRRTTRTRRQRSPGLKMFLQVCPSLSSPFLISLLLCHR